MNAVDSPGGALWVQPGAPRPHNLRSTRPDWVGRATRGLAADALPQTLGRLFGLCSRAHVACAGLALRAARFGSAEVPAELRTELAAQTARDHVQQIWLQWPARLAPPSAAEGLAEASRAALAAYPAFTAQADPGALADWLARHALGMPAAAWLAQWERDPAGWLRHWCHDAKGPLPQQWLRACRSDADRPLPDFRPLRVHADADALRAFADELRDPAANPARLPQWRGRCAETGPWTRLAEPAAQARLTPWLRLGARLADTVRLALPDESGRSGAAWLALGALPLAEGEGLAWVEMARGLLMHHVRLDGSGDAARVAACQVLAPTDWNFHPEGAFAQLVETLPPQPDAAAGRWLESWVAAYAPCVPLQRAPVARPRETAHA